MRWLSGSCWLRFLGCLAVLGGVLLAPSASEAWSRHSSRVEPVHSVANRCYAVAAFERRRWFPKLLTADDTGDGYAFASVWPWQGSAFFLKPSGLGTYLFYDESGSYLVSDGAQLQRQDELLSDILLVDDRFESPAEWAVESVGRGRFGRLRLRHVASGRYLATSGLVSNARAAARLHLVPRRGCARFPELSVDASGKVRPRRFRDGSVFGFVDAHSHLFANFGFGGGGIFHGSPFHPLGVEHALPDCAQFHGVEGRQDLLGFGFDSRGTLDPEAIITLVANGGLPEPNHETAGWPEFTEWPAAPRSSTHQVQYYRWLERAYLGGLRLVVQHAVSNQVICDLVRGLDIQPLRYDCNDMVAVDRSIEAVYEMEAYIDAQEGGPGRGWFRIVSSPREARRVIRRGKMAVVLGIETSNLFDCFLTPPGAGVRCSEEDVVEALDRYHALGIRALFPVHKYDNGFSAGDGDRGFIELGNMINSGHFTNFTEDCDFDAPGGFDNGPSAYPGLVSVRDDYLAPPAIDFSNFVTDPLGSVLQFVGDLFIPPNGIEVCQAAGMTPLGEFLIEQMMRRGMILEVDHFPQRAYERVYEILERNDYPPVATHGRTNRGRVHRLGGISTTSLGGLQDRVESIAANGGFPAEGFGFDLNGFAGAPGPSFGTPIEYPFRSYARDVVFHPPRVGERALDFSTEGLVHIGMVPELIQEYRQNGMTDEELEPLFKSAEAYLRMWEKAERRGRRLRRGR